jgi:hypothetical protein
MKLKWLPRNSSALSKCGDTFLQSWNWATPTAISIVALCCVRRRAGWRSEEAFPARAQRFCPRLALLAAKRVEVWEEGLEDICCTRGRSSRELHLQTSELNREPFFAEQKTGSTKAYRISVEKLERKNFGVSNSTPCSVIYVYRHFRGTYCFHVQERRISWAVEWCSDVGTGTTVAGALTNQ